MTNLSETLAKHIEAANVLVLAGRIEDNIEKLLLVAGRPVSNKVAERIFTGMGPLGSFAGKIHVAYLFELIDEPAFHDLLIVKDVRNIFAHTTQYVFFSHERVAAKCRNLSTWQVGDTAQGAFYMRSTALFDELAGSIDKLIFAKALQNEPSPVLDEE